MDNASSEVHIKQEYCGEETCSPRVLASKIYCIEPSEQENGEECNSYFGVPKVEDNCENEMEITEPEYSEDSEGFYDDLFIGKEEIQIPNISNSGGFKCEANGVAALDDSQEKGSSECEFTDKSELTKRKHRGELNIKIASGEKREIDINQTNKILLCPFCGTEFPDSHEWRHHLNDVHEFNKLENMNIESLTDDIAKCKQCDMKLRADIRRFQQHKITHLPYPKYVKCKVCAKCFAHFSGYKKHTERYHDDIETHLSNKRLEGIGWQSTATLLCPYCGAEYPNTVAWRQHLNDVHQFHKHDNWNMELFADDTAKCKQCQTKLNTKEISHLQQHKIKHLPYCKFIKCKVCGKCFAYPVGYKTHIERYHDDIETDESNNRLKVISWQSTATLLCPYCGAEYPNTIAWRQHLNAVHEFNNRKKLNIEFLHDKTAKCRQCKEILIKTSLSILQIHKIKHLPYNHYVKCKMCRKLFSSGGIHKHHVGRVHNGTELEKGNNHANTILLCPFCGKEFHNSTIWREHLGAIHDFNNKRVSLDMEFLNDKKAKCKQCKVTLSSSLATLQMHKISHLPYKLYFKCELCERVYSSRWNLKLHLKREHNDKIK